MKTFAAFALMALASALKIELAAPVVDNELELAQADAQAEFWDLFRWIKRPERIAIAIPNNKFFVHIHLKFSHYILALRCFDPTRTS